MGEGHIVEYGSDAWGSTGFFLVPRRATRGLKRRWVVRVSVVHVPLAITLYPDETDSPCTQPTAHMADRRDKLVLWDEDRMRRTPKNGGDSSSTVPSTAACGRERGNAASAAATTGRESEALPLAELQPASTTEPHLSSTAGASGETVMGMAGFVTPSESFFAGELAGVEALSARHGEAGEGEAEAKLGEPVEVEQQPVPADVAPAADGSGVQEEISLLQVRD